MNDNINLNDFCVEAPGRGEIRLGNVGQIMHGIHRERKAVEFLNKTASRESSLKHWADLQHSG